MGEVVQAVEKLKKEWNDTHAQTLAHVNSIKEYGKTGKGTEEGNSLQRLNGLAQDGLALLRSMQFRLDLLALQMPTDDEVQSAQLMFKSWKDQYQSLHLGLRDANLQAKANIRKAAQAENKGWNDICCRKHHREPSAHSSTDGSGGGTEFRHAYDFRRINWSVKEGRK